MVQLDFFFKPNAASTPDTTLVKPFLKWAGGKTQLLEQIITYMPEDFSNRKIRKYIEPFIGGGAVFFYIAQNFRGIDEFVIADANRELILLYNVVQTHVDKLIDELKTISDSFLQLKEDKRKEYYYDIRTAFNNTLSEIDFFDYQESWTVRAAQIIFLNRTCFNGLFRVNSKGGFNVPFGKYANPRILDEKNLKAASAILKNTKIILGDFSNIDSFVDESTFVYFDPPYRPISATASFNSYAKDAFGDKEQLRLAEFYRKLNGKKAKLMLSNSDPMNIDSKDTFFEDAYREFHIKRVKASRIINSKAELRGEIDELLIMNY